MRTRWPPPAVARLLGDRRRRIIAASAVAIIVVLAVVGWLVFRPRPHSPATVSLSDAESLIARHQVKVARLDDSARTATLVLQSGQQVVVTYPQNFGADLSRQLLASGADVSAKAVPKSSPWQNIIALGLIGLIILAFLRFVVMRNNPGRFGRSRQSKPASVPDTRFGDVAGVDEVVAELSEIAEFLHRPDPFEAAGAHIPRGFLLIGPPGTGKTLLARAVAGEAGVPFFALSGSDFVETFVGVGAARVRRLFDEARRTERAIIFIDELDAIGRARASGTQPGANDERESTLNQLLVEMDGFRRSNIIVLAATNRPDVLDPALLRPGRFDRRITVAPPDRRGRTAILELHSTSYHLGGDVDLPTLARRTPGMTGADLAFLINEAALTAARQGRVDITQQHVEAALAVTVLGRERPSAVIMERDRRITAWHEAGHAVAALVEPDADDPVQITIVPRGQAGGVTWMAGNDHALVTRREASARLVVALAGRAAEELLLDGDFTQGAANDFAHATRLASDMVTQYGMSPLGVASISPEHLAYGTQADRVNTAVSQLLDEALDLARTLLQVNSGLVRAVAEQLLVDETVTLDDMLRLRQQARADF